jgi:hypothetical protein
MLKIKSSQIEALSRLQLDSFMDRVLTRLRKSFPKARTISDNDGYELIQQGIERAAAYDIISERDVAKYVGLMLLWGREFDSVHTDSWVVSILRNPTLDPGYKLDLLYDHAAQEREPT